MLKNLKRKFAKVALVVLALQLAFLGLGVNAGAAHALSSILLKTDINEQAFVAGKVSAFTVTLSNKDGIDYPKVLSTFEIAKAQTTDIDSFQYFETKDSIWYNVPLANSGLNVVGYFGDPTVGFPVAAGYEATSQFRITFKTPGTYSASLEVKDLTDGTVLSTLPINGLKVAENISLTAALPTSVQLGATVPFDAVLDNTYGLGHTVNTTVTVKDSLIGNIKLKNGAADVVLTQGATDSTVVFPGTIVAGAKVTDLFNLTVSFLNVDKVYTYTVDVTDAISSELLATYSGAVFADGSAPVITMTSKPIIVSDAKKAIEVTFTGNEAIALSSKNVTFKQGALVYLGTPAPQAATNVLVVYTPADFFANGVAPIDVTASFVDLVGNVALFAGQIQVDTVAPAAVTGLTTLVNPDGTVTLSWVNPPAGTYSGLRVVRVGDFTVSLTATVETYTDNTTERGKTYEYSIVAYDEAGNETATTPVSVTVPAPVIAAAVSDTNSYVAPQVSTNTDTSLGTDTEVKANVTEDNKTADEQSDFPVWGIILLVILALVGGYLIWNQKPALEPVVTVETKNKTANTKKK